MGGGQAVTSTREAILAYLGDQHRRNPARVSSFNAIQIGAKRRLGGVCPPISEVESEVDTLVREQRVVAVLTFRGPLSFRLRTAGDR